MPPGLSEFVKTIRKSSRGMVRCRLILCQRQQSQGSSRRLHKFTTRFRTYRINLLICACENVVLSIALMMPSVWWKKNTKNPQPWNNLRGVAVTCATSRLSTCARWPDQRYRPGFESGLGREDRSSAFRHVCYRINILGSHLSPSSINLVLAQAGDVSWCRTGHASQTIGYYRIPIYGLTALRKGHELQPEWGNFTLLTLPVKNDSETSN